MKDEEKRVLYWRLAEERWDTVADNNATGYTRLDSALFDYMKAKFYLELVAKDTMDKIDNEVEL